MADVAINLAESNPVQVGGLNLSLLKFQTIAQVVAGLTITTAVVAATVIATTIFVSTVKYDYPTANPDIAYTWKKTAIPIYVLANDKDPRDQKLVIDSVTQARYGSVKISPDNGYVIYTPNDRYAGMDYFNYTAKNDKLTGSSYVTVLVKNHAPDVFDQLYKINKNSQNNVLKVFEFQDPTTKRKFSDDDGDPLTITSCIPALHGQIAIADNNVIYTPNLNFNGNDKTNCSVTDGNATVFFGIDLKVENNAPEARPDFVTIPKNTMALIEVLANDFDINNDPLTVTSVDNIAKGNAKETDDKKGVMYSPTWTSSTTTDSFEYSCSDGSLPCSSYAVITLQNNAPTAKDITAIVAKNSVDNVVTFRLCDRTNMATPFDYCDTDAAESTVVDLSSFNVKTVKWEFRRSAKNESVRFGDDSYYSLERNTYTLVFSPNVGQQYTDTFTYRVTDSGGLTATAKINLIIGNQPPTAPNITDTCSKRLSTYVNIMTGNPKPYDSDGDSVAFSSVQAIPGTTKGTVSKFNSTHAFYTAPANGFTGVDTFSYTVNDVQQKSKENLFTTGRVEVSIHNDPPVPSDDTGFVVHKGIPFAIPVLNNDMDPNSDDIFVKDIGATAMQATVEKVTETVNGKQVDKIKYTSLNSVYSDSFKYNIRDEDNLVSLNWAQVSLNVVNDAPVASADSYSVLWNSTTTFSVLDNDNDANPGDKNILYITAVSTPNQGGSVINKGTTIQYSPAPGFTGTETFTYTIKDQYDTSAPATVTVTVSNNAPVAVDDIATKHHLTPYIYIDVLANDADPQGEPIALLSTNLNRATVVNVNGKTVIQYSSAQRFTGQESFTYTITDWGLTATGTVRVTVTDTAPVTVADYLSIHWSDKTGHAISVLDNDSDAEDDPLTLTTVSTPQKGSAFVSGSYVNYTGPAGGFKGTVTMDYQVDDGALSSTGAITVTVTNANPPVANPLSVRAHWRTQTTGTDIKLISSTLDQDGDTVTFTTGTSAQGITVTPFDGTTVRYQKQNWAGTDSFGYTVSDGLDSASSTVNVEIYNNPPLAKNISVFLPPNSRVAGILIPVMDSVTDDDFADVAALTLTGVGMKSSNAQTVQIESGQVRYIPTNEFGGNDMFSYSVFDGLTTSIGYVFVTVASAVTASATNTYRILWNTQAIGSTFTVTQTLNKLNAQATNGFCTLNSATSISYKQNNNYLGGDYCQFYFTTESSTTNTLDVYFDVYDTPPTANAFSQSVHWRTLVGGIDLDVAQGATDADGDSVNLASATNGARGTTSIVSGKVRYIATAPSLETDNFNFKVSDGLLTTTKPASIRSTNNVIPSATPLTATVHWRTITTDNGFTVDVLSSLTDSEGDTLTLTVVSPTSTGGTVSVVNGGKSVKLQHRDFVGTDVITYTIFDGISSSQSTITVTITNTAPVTTPDSYSYHWRTAAAGVTLSPSPVANDNDENGDPISINKVGTQFSLSGSTATLQSGNIKYTSPASTSGVDSFTYGITDTRADASGMITVNLTNTAPVAPTVNVTTLWRSPIAVAAICTDENADPITGYSLQSQPQMGGYSISNTGSGTFTPDAARISYTLRPDVDGKYKATDSWNYACTDTVSTSYGNMKVIIYNTPPTANPDTFTFQRDFTLSTPRVLDVLLNDVDADGDTVTLESTVTSTQNSVVSVSNGKINYSPSPSFVGVDILTYSIFDGNLRSTGTVTITMQNSPPVCNDIVKTNLIKQQEYKYYLASFAGCADANNDVLTYNIPNGNSFSKGSFVKGTDAGGFYVTYKSNGKRSGVDSIQFDVSDGISTVTNTLSVSTKNNAPSTTAVSFTSPKTPTDLAAVSLNVLQNVVDQDSGDSVVLVSVSPYQCTAAGTFSKSGNQANYAQKGGYAGSCKFQFTFSDDDIDDVKIVTAEATLNIINRPPVAIDHTFIANQGEQRIIPISDLVAGCSDPDGDSISFKEVLCNQPGTCPKPYQILNGYITIPADDTTCGSIRYGYSIVTPDNQIATASFYVKYINCRCKNPSDIVFVLDGSGSINSNDWVKARNFVGSMIGMMDISPQLTSVGVVQFAGSWAGYSSPYGFALRNSDSAAIISTATGLTQRKGGTPTLYGLMKGIDLLNTGRSNVMKTIVLVTDGEPNYPCSCSACTSFYGMYGGTSGNCSSPYFPGQACGSCSGNSYYCMPCSDFRPLCAKINSWTNWRVVTVGIGSIPTLGRTLLTQSAYSSSSAFFPSDWTKLNDIYTQIIDESC